MAKLALTIYQPWTSLIVAGAKPLEFRSWDFMARGYAHVVGQRIVIHASARPWRREELAELINMPADQLRAAFDDRLGQALDILEGAWRGERELPLAAALGTARIGQPIRKPGWDNYGWPMLEPEAFEKPIPAKGSQGFWVWEPDPVPNGHSCAATGCQAIIELGTAYCFRHWLMVPRKLQREILRCAHHDMTGMRFAIERARYEIAAFEGVELTEAAQ